MDRVAENKNLIKEQFVKQYREEVSSFLRAQEVYRKKIYRKTLCFSILSILAFIVFLVFPFVFPLSLRTDGLFRISAQLFCVLNIASVIFMMLCIWVNFVYVPKKAKEYALFLKQNCLQKILDVFGDIKWKNNTNVISNFELKGCGLFAMFNRRTTDDEFIGNYKGVDFEVCETHLTHESGSGKNRRCINIFKGVIFRFKTEKQIKAKVIVSTKGDLTARDNNWIWLTGGIPCLQPTIEGIVEKEYGSAIFFGIITILLMVGIFIFSLKARKVEKKQEKIILEDVKFGKKYHVYSDDQIEARCVVNPAFMEKFLNLRTAFGAKNAKCSFNGYEVMFAIQTTKNLFEIGSLDKTLLEPESMKKIYTEISAIYDLIDYFKLDR